MKQPRLVCLPRVFKSIVQAVRATLPELDRVRMDAVPSPKARQRDLASAELRLQMLPLHVEYFA